MRPDHTDESGAAPTKPGNHNAAVSAALEADTRVRVRLGFTVAAFGLLLLGIVVMFANRSSPPDGGTAASTVSKEANPAPAAPGDAPSKQHEAASPTVALRDSSEDHELREDGRVYSVALVAATPGIPVGAKLFAQGRVLSFDYADGMRSRPLAIIEDEQQPGKRLLCAMMGEEGVEVLSLYHVGEIVAVSGEYMATASLGGYPAMPILRDCHVAGPKANVVRTVPPTNDKPPEPAESPEVVTPDALYRFPKLYQHRRIQLVGWEHALVQTARSAHAVGPLIPPDCKYVLDFVGGLGCVSAIPEHLLNPFGAAIEEDITLICTVEIVTQAGSLLTHCELSPSTSRKMKDREYELETGKSPLSADTRHSREDSKYAEAQLPMDAGKYRPIGIRTASCTRLPDTPDTVMCVSSATVRDKGAYITLDGAPAREGDVSLTCFSGKWETCRRLAYQTYGFEVIGDGSNRQECQLPSWLAHGMLEGKGTGCIKIHAQPYDLIYIIADGDGLCGHGNPQACW